MAFTDLVPQTPVMNLIQNDQAQMAITTQNAAGSNIDITGWNAFRLDIFVNGGSGQASPLLSSAPTLTGGSGTAKLGITAAQSVTIPPGTFQYVLSGKNLVGDDYQLVASGSCIVRPMQ